MELLLANDCLSQLLRRHDEQINSNMDPSKDDADEASYGQHKNRCKRENPNRPKLLSILIGVLIVTVRSGH
jgi:hypothetical protein